MLHARENQSRTLAAGRSHPDVAHYVLPEEPLDRDCLKRGRSIYLGETVLPMLPERSFSAALVLPGSERLARTVLLLDSATGQLVEFEIQPTIIQVDYQSHEQQLQADS